MKNNSRRSFIKNSATATAGAFVLPQFSIAQSGPSANSKLNIAMVGAGGIAYMAYPPLRSENIVALCDVDANKLLEHKEKHPDIEKARTFNDFRVMFDQMHKEIDAVVISTPDHTHFAATMAAMERGLHVYTQKPLTHTIWESRTLKMAKDKYGLVTNMGNQGHTYTGIRQMREWLEADVLGEVTEAHSWQIGGGWGFPTDYQPQPATAPETLDWDLWLGPSNSIPYYHRIHPGGWRRWQAYGAGMLGDWFPHVADGPVWALDLYDPIAVEAEVTEGGSQWLTPSTLRIRWDFASRGNLPPCSLYWYNSDDNLKPTKPENWGWEEELPRGGSLFMGAKNTVYTDSRSNNPRLASREDMKAFKEAGLPEETYPRVEGGPFEEWIRAINSLVMFECSFFADNCLMTKEISRMTGLISEDRQPPPACCQSLH